MMRKAESSGVVTACAISLESIRAVSFVEPVFGGEESGLLIVKYEFGEVLLPAGIETFGTVGDSVLVDGRPKGIGCITNICREDLLGGGDIGGFGELKDLDETRVKLSMDFEVRRLRPPSLPIGLPDGLVGRDSTGLSKLVMGEAKEDASGENGAGISSALIPLSAGRGA